MQVRFRIIIQSYHMGDDLLNYAQFNNGALLEITMINEFDYVEIDRVEIVC